LDVLIIVKTSKFEKRRPQTICYWLVIEKSVNQSGFESRWRRQRLLELGAEWRRIFNIVTIEELIKERREEILRIAARHGAHNVRVFGSVVRGEARPDSDVDFLVDMDPGRTLLDMGGLLMELREILGREVDVVTERGLKARTRDRIIKEASPL
jgi:predicted nucleotidyltransferase